MVTVPQRLLGLHGVDAVYRDDDLVVLRKRLSEPVRERASYVSMHALGIVAEGRQVVYGGLGKPLRVGPGEVAALRRGLYTLTDLLADDTGAFASTVVFCSDRLLRSSLTAIGWSSPAATVAPDLSRLDAPTARTWACEFAAAARGQALTGREAHELCGELLRLLGAEGGPAAVAALAQLAVTARRPMRALMREHFDKPLGLADYAALSGRSERSFRRDFRARFGESPKRWLVARRLERARELLRDGRLPVGDVAAAVGYASASHFIAVYKARYGETPGRVRGLNHG